MTTPMIEEKSEGWMCTHCGHYEESEFHCSVCGQKPLWGCDCDSCRAEDEKWTKAWEDYLAGKDDFEQDE